ncbi:MAG: SpaA isopeptide-forming pilin-related protein, partial [Eubacterium sp.]|nr:SpaA isopeptide-forming pilin-related protein [Eubacterium sp.]
DAGVSGERGSATYNRVISALKTCIATDDSEGQNYMREWRISTTNNGGVFNAGDKITITDTLPVGYLLDPTPFRFFISDTTNDYGEQGIMVAPSYVDHSALDNKTNRVTFVAEIKLDENTAEKFTKGMSLGMVYWTRMSGDYYKKVLEEAGKTESGVSLTLENNAVIEAGGSTAKADATHYANVTVPQDLFDKSITSQSQNPANGSLTANYRITVNKGYEDLNEDNGDGSNAAKTLIKVTDTLGTKLRFKADSVKIAAYEKETNRAVTYPGDGYKIEGDTITFTLHDDIYYVLTYTAESDELLYEKDLTDPNYAAQMRDEIKNRYGNTAKLETDSATSVTVVRLLNDQTYRLDAYLNYQLTISGTKNWLNTEAAGNNDGFVLIVTQIERYLPSIAKELHSDENRTRFYYHFSKEKPTETEKTIDGETHYYIQAADTTGIKWSYSIPRLTVNDTKGSTYSYLVEEMQIDGYTPSYRYIVDENGVVKDTVNSHYEIEGTSKTAKVEITNLSTNRYARPGTIYLHKYNADDETKTQLGGAVFRLERISGSGTLNELTAAGQKNVLVENATDIRYGETSLTFKTIETAGSTVIGSDGNKTPYVKIQGIPFGKYKITEVTAPRGYGSPDPENSFTFEIKLDGEAIKVIESAGKTGSDRDYDFDTDSGVLHVKNTPDESTVTGSVTVKKIDADTLAALPGATFKLETASNANLSGVTVDGTELSLNGSFEAAALGAVIEGLPVGAYSLTETKAPTGYVKTDERFTFTVEADGTVTGAVNGTITVTNKAVTAGIKVIKNGEKADGSLVENLPDAVFSLSSGKAIDWAKVSLNGENGTGTDISHEFTTGDGAFAIEGLPVGKYTLTETVAPSGYQKTKALDLEIKADGAVVSDDERFIAPNTFTFTDEQLTGSLSIRKVDENGKLLPGAKLTLTATDGSFATAKADRSNTVSKADGRFVIFTLGETASVTGLAPGTYTLTETEAPTGYLRTDEEFTFTVEADGKVTGAANGTITVTNTAVTAAINVVKNGENADGTLVENLPDAVFSLFGEGAVDWDKVSVTDSDGRAVTITERSTDHIAFRSTGSETIAGLSIGEYTLTETVAPERYLTDQAWKFEVEADGKVASVDPSDSRFAPGENTITFTDQRITDGTIAITKRGEQGNLLPGAVFIVERNNDCDLTKATVTGTDIVTKTAEKITFTTEDKQVKIAGLSEGSYTITEVAAPSGYIAKPDAKKTVTLARSADAVGSETVTITNERTRVSVDKVDMTDGVKQLSGASLTIAPIGGTLAGAPISVADAGGAIAFTKNDDELVFKTTDRTATIAGLPAGDYCLTETAAPGGYAITTDFYFSIDALGKVSETAGHDNKENTLDETAKKITLKDAPLLSLAIRKTDTEGEPLSGARFTLSSGTVSDWTNVRIGSDALANGEEFEISADGAAIAGLLAGSYTLTETSAPTGYAGAEDSFRFTLEKDGGGIKIEPYTTVRAVGEFTPSGNTI